MLLAERLERARLTKDRSWSRRLVFERLLHHKHLTVHSQTDWNIVNQVSSTVPDCVEPFAMKFESQYGTLAK